jgi:hypothetical protein
MSGSCSSKNTNAETCSFFATSALRTTANCGQPWNACQATFGAASASAMPAAAAKPGTQMARRAGDSATPATSESAYIPIDHFC